MDGGRAVEVNEAVDADDAAASAREHSITAGLSTVEMKEDNGALFDRLQTWAKAAIEHWRPWWEVSSAEFDFYAGRQWSEDDKAILERQLRPAITFNRTAPVIDSLVGMEINNREMVQVYPRKIGAAKQSDLWTSALMWARDEASASAEEADAFIDLAISGVGWTDTYLKESCSEAMAYDIGVDRVDNAEMAVDPNSRKRNFRDARFLARIRRIPLEAAKELFPDADDNEMHAGWANYFDTDAAPGEQPERYLFGEAPKYSGPRRTVVIVEVQWWEKATYWQVLDPFDNQVRHLDDAMFKEAQRRYEIQVPGGNLRQYAARYKRKVYRRAFLGAASIIAKPQMPYPYGFTYRAMTGKRDKTRKHWFGLMRAMIDPQMWANKWLSQIMHIINTNAKGGILAAKDAFEDWRKVETNWANPSYIAWLAEGKTAADVQQREPARLPEGLANLMDFATGAVTSVNGFSLEMIGTADREQAASLEYQRRQSGVTLLAQFFSAMREYRKDQGKAMLYMIQKWISDGRLIRVALDQGDEQYAPLLTDPQEGTIDYDLIVDEAPSSPNQKEMVWSLLLQAMPILANAPLPPAAWLELLRYSPFPQSVITKLGEAMSQGPDEAQQMQQKLSLALMGAQVQQLRGQAEESKADVVAKLSKAIKDVTDARATAAQPMAPPPVDAAAAVQPAAEQTKAAVEPPQQPPPPDNGMAMLDRLMPLLLQATQPQPQRRQPAVRIQRDPTTGRAVGFEPIDEQPTAPQQ